MAPRLEIDEADLTDGQRRRIDRLVGGPRGKFAGPFRTWLLAEDAFDAVEALGTYARYRCAIEPRLRELVILTVAHHWQCRYELRLHAEHARHAGVPPATIEALAAGMIPADLDEKAADILQMVRDLLAGGAVPAQSFERARRHCSQRQIVDLTLLVGYYSTAAFALNAGAAE